MTTPEFNMAQELNSANEEMMRHHHEKMMQDFQDQSLQNLHNQALQELNKPLYNPVDPTINENYTVYKESPFYIHHDGF